MLVLTVPWQAISTAINLLYLIKTPKGNDLMDWMQCLWTDMAFPTVVIAIEGESVCDAAMSTYTAVPKISWEGVCLWLRQCYCRNICGKNTFGKTQHLKCIAHNDPCIRNVLIYCKEVLSRTFAEPSETLGLTHCSVPFIDMNTEILAYFIPGHNSFFAVWIPDQFLTPILGDWVGCEKDVTRLFNVLCLTNTGTSFVYYNCNARLFQCLLIFIQYLLI